MVWVFKVDTCTEGAPGSLGDAAPKDPLFARNFDVADYSLKYAGCSAVATWSDDLAENNADDGNDGGNANGYYGGEWQSSTVVSMPKFVVFRLCPTDSCSDDRTFGCSNDYGEYIIDLTEYVQYLKEYKEEQLQ